MRKIREALRLSFEGLSTREMALSLAIGRTTLREYLGRARDAGLSWPLPDALSDAILYIASAGCASRLPALLLGKAPTSPLSICPEIGKCRGPQAPKTTQNFYKKARSAFLFFLVQGWII